jgi:melibiose permease/lactose/raffinose/galactose permease
MDMIYIGVAGVLLFVGQAFIQLLMLMFLADTVEYGQWKLGRRNESITFSVQPFINKIVGALANGIVGVTLIISGINSAATPNDVTPGGLTIMKLAMLILPLIFIVAGYVIYRFKFKIDKEMFDKIVLELGERGDFHA